MDEDPIHADRIGTVGTLYEEYCAQFARAPEGAERDRLRQLAGAASMLLTDAILVARKAMEGMKDASGDPRPLPWR